MDPGLDSDMSNLSIPKILAKETRTEALFAKYVCIFGILLKFLSIMYCSLTGNIGNSGANIN